MSDEGYSGAFLERPALAEIRELVRARKIDAVLVHDIDRLSRKLAHQMILQDEFERFGVRLECLTTPHSDSPESKLMMHVKGVVAEYEREKIRERTMRGRVEKLRQGFVMTARRPYGYEYRGKADGDRGSLRVIEEEAAVVRRIFADSIRGLGLRTIAYSLTSEGIKPQRGERWGANSIRRILRNPVYTGQARCNFYRWLKDPETGKKRLIERPESDWIMVQVPPIIDRSVFDAASLGLARNSEVLSGRPSNHYALRGLVWCAVCGRRLNGSTSDSGAHREYRCVGRDRVRNAGIPCGVTIATNKVEMVVLDGLREMLLGGGLKRLIRDHVASLAPKVDTTEVRNHIEKLRAKESRIVSMMLDAELESHQAAMKAELRQIATTRGTLEAQLREADMAGRLVDVDALCREAAKRVENLAHENRQAFFQHLVRRVEVNPGVEVRVQCVLRGGGQNRIDHVDDWAAGVRQNDAG